MARFGVDWQVPSALTAIALGGLVVFIGCNRTPPAANSRVSGLVALEGRPLAGGFVVFVPDADRATGGKMFTATVNADGRFALADGAAVVPPGWYRVAIGDSPGGELAYVFPAELRRPDFSGVEREVLPGHDHHFEFLIELTR